jgi:Glycolipid 2-alpha-mannosyltransferase
MAAEHGILPVRDFFSHPSRMSSLRFFLMDEADFWSNFEIGSLDFYRSEAYTAYFEHLDKAGGFFYERWGDAPVHSIAACLFLKPEQMCGVNLSSSILPPGARQTELAGQDLGF